MESTLQFKKLHRHLVSHRNLISCFWALGTEAIETIKERFSQNIKINCYIMMVKYRFPKPAKPDPSYRSTI